MRPRAETLRAALDAVLALAAQRGMAPVGGNGSARDCGSAGSGSGGGSGPAGSGSGGGSGPAGRVMVGIAGPPGVGKSTLAGALTAALPSQCSLSAVAVGMDGFHLANAELERLGLANRKGAPQTFDAAGFVHLLRRLRTQGDDIVYAPAYSRTVHESIGSAVPVPPEVRVVVVEGNYLLLDEEPWRHVRGLLDLVLYLDAPDRLRHDALVRRQLSRGLDERAARAWVDESDEANARLIASTRQRADAILRRGGAVPA